ncbi:ATP-binding protein [Clostridium sp. C8-1-8]|uniref:ATP-binding protein n=1 Tax=Clostridium sp. C8-1-8 TaxID=2698831 RepID=UPI001368E96F|nr:ATP-binding protein [Clostridium sp. C8-1-8]
MIRKMEVFIILLLLGVILNLFSIPLPFGTDFLLGGICTILCYYLFGVKYAVISALIVNYRTVLLWGHPYAIVASVMEVLMIYLIIRKTKIKTLLMADIIYWCTLGAALVYVAYLYVMKVSADATLLVVLKQGINGIFNVLLANILYMVIPFSTIINDDVSSKISLKNILFNSIGSLILTLSLIYIVISGNRELSYINNNGRSMLDIASNSLAYYIKENLDEPNYSLDLLDTYSNNQNLIISFRQNNGNKLYSNKENDMEDKWHSVGQLFNLGSGMYRWVPNIATPPIKQWEESYYIKTQPIDDGIVTIKLELRPYIKQLYDTNIKIFSIIAISIGLLLLILSLILNILLKPLSNLANITYQLPEKIKNHGIINLERETLVEEISILFSNFKAMQVALKDSFEDLEEQYEKTAEQLNITTKRLDNIQFAVDKATFVCIVDGNGNIIHANKNICKLLQYTYEELHNKKFDFLNLRVVGKDSIDNIKNIINSGETWSGDLSVVGKDSIEHLMFSTMVPILNEVKGRSQFIIISIDVTEQREVEHHKEEFINMVSHELRTPMTSIFGFIELLMHKELNAQKQKKYLEIIYKEAKRLSDLINDFLDLQKMISGKQKYDFVCVDINEMMKDILDQWKLKHENITLEIPEEEVIVDIDSNRITQVLHNLISNAIKYSTENSKVEVRVIIEEKFVKIDVKDHGLGIPESEKKNIFSKFYRVDNSDSRQVGGTGLGLAICKEIVEAHGGKIYFESQLGSGSTFSIELKRCL